MKFSVKRSAISLLLSVVMALGVFSADILTVSAEQPESFGLPVVSIYTDDPDAVITKEDKTPARASLYSGEQTIMDAAIEIKGRGNSTWAAPKKPYQIKFDKKTSLFGLPKAKKWILLANYFDRSFIRNYMAFSLAGDICSDYTPTMRFVDLYINGEYQGNYVLSEKVEIGVGRVETADDGFLVEIDMRQDENHVFTTSRSVPFAIKEPEYDPITPDMDEDDAEEILEAVGEIRSYIQSVEDMICSHDSRCLDRIDVGSFIDWYIVNELYKNIDSAFFSSCYMYLGADGKLIMGPLWDLDLALGLSSSQGMSDPTGFHTNSALWYRELMKIPEFRSALLARWNELSDNGVFDGFFEQLASVTEQIRVSVSHDNRIWPVSAGRDSFGSPVLGFDMELDYAKGFYARRLAWLNEQLCYDPDPVNSLELLIKGLPDCVTATSGNYISTVTERYDSLSPAQKNRVDPGLLKRYFSVLNSYRQKDRTTGLKAVSVDKCVVRVNEPFRVSCVLSPDIMSTADDKRIFLTNENGLSISYSDLRIDGALPDGNVKWSFDCSVGSVGYRTLTLSSGGRSMSFDMSVLSAAAQPPDRSALSDIVGQARAFLDGKHNDALLGTLRTQTERSAAVLQNCRASQSDINSAAASLRTALNGVTSRPVYAYFDAEVQPADDLTELTVVAPSDVSGVKLFDAIMNEVALEDLTRTDDGARSLWRCKIRQSEFGSHTYGVYTVSGNGAYGDSGARVISNVTGNTLDPVIYSVSAPSGHAVGGGTLDIRATTSTTVRSLTLLDDDGNELPQLAGEPDFNGDAKEWSLSVDAPKNAKDMTVTVKCAGADGVFSDDSRELTVDVLPGDSTSYVVSASARSGTAFRNEPFTVTAYTSMNARDIRIVNEKGLKLGTVSKSVSVDGDMKKWTCTIKVATDGARTFTVQSTNSDGSHSPHAVSFDIEIIPPEDEVRVDRAEPSVTQAPKNEEFQITVYTSKNAQSLKLTNESGGAIGIKYLETSVEGRFKKWIVSARVGTAGRRTLTMSCKGPDGNYSPISGTFTIVIGSDRVTVNGIVAPDTDVLRNESFDVTVCTSPNASSIRIENENGAVITVRSLRSTTEGDSRKWTATLSVGTAGRRTLSVRCADANGAWSQETTPFGVNIVSQPVEAMIVSAVPSSGSAARNQPFEVTVYTTSSVSFIKTTNESGAKVGMTVVGVKRENDLKKWTTTVKIGTAGNRRLTVHGSASSVDFTPYTQQFDIIITN